MEASFIPEHGVCMYKDDLELVGALSLARLQVEKHRAEQLQQPQAREVTTEAAAVKKVVGRDAKGNRAADARQIPEGQCFERMLDDSQSH